MVRILVSIPTCQYIIHSLYLSFLSIIQRCKEKPSHFQAKKFNIKHRVGYFLLLLSLSNLSCIHTNYICMNSSAQYLSLSIQFIYVLCLFLKILGDAEGYPRFFLQSQCKTKARLVSFSWFHYEIVTVTKQKVYG